jgi:UDP-glucuronate 4-epimerase
MKILITGGAGFIGSHLSKKLITNGSQVVIINRIDDKSSKLKTARLDKLLNPDEYTFYNLELSTSTELRNIFKEHNFDVICHLAAKTNLEFNSELYNRTNILATISIFEMAKEFKVPKVIFASSSMVYGNNLNLPFTESDNTDHPLSIYAASKKSDEVLAYTYHYLHGIKMIGLRFFTTYGPWGRPDMSISRFTERIINGDPIEIHNFGKIKRDYTYIDDITDGIIAAIGADIDYEIFNLGSGQSIELEKIICLIENNLGIKANKKYIPMQPGDLSETWANIEKAKKLLNYRPKITIDEGINRFIDWYKQYYSL